MNDELDFEAISRDAGEFMDQNLRLAEPKPEDEEEKKQAIAAENEKDHLLVDGQDLRNHPEFERLRLDIPWQEDEGTW